MKQIFRALIIIFSLAGCRLTDGGNSGGGSTGAEFTVTNSSVSTVYFTLDDASAAPLPEYTLAAFDSQTFYWDADSDLFALGNGQLVLTYWFDGTDEITVYLQINPGDFEQYSIGSEQYHLIVSNDTSADVWFWVDAGPVNLLEADESLGFSFDNLLGPEAITLYYRGDHVFSADELITIAPGIIKDFSIVATGGAIDLYNDSVDIDIMEVYIAPSDSLYWGPNLINQPIEELQSVLWTVGQNYWDILIVDENSTEKTLYDQLVILDETVVLRYSDFILSRQHRHPAGNADYTIEEKAPKGVKKTEEL
jgi:hypothetical protein